MAVVFKGYYGAGLQAARIAGEHPVMDDVANHIAALARGYASGHGSLSTTISTQTIKGKRGVTDRLVTMDHAYAASIEFGHVQSVGKNHEGPGRFVPGLHIMGRAAGVR